MKRLLCVRGAAHRGQGNNIIGRCLALLGIVFVICVTVSPPVNASTGSVVPRKIGKAVFPVPIPARLSPPVSVMQWCPLLVKRLPKFTVAQCKNSALKTSGFVSLRGFPLLVRDVSAHSMAGAVGAKSVVQHPIRILLIGGIHGDERTASSIVLQWLDALNQSEVQEFQWRIAPLVNPDGLLAAKATRVNANGVDLNRNFPTPNWSQEAPRYWKARTGSDPRRFPGRAPLSEPESRWVSDQIDQFRPDVIISVHAPFGVLDFDGPATPPRRFGRLIFDPVGVYPGSLGNYCGLHRNIPVVTIELANAIAMPSDVEVARIWQDMLSWVRRNVKSAKPVGKLPT